MDFGRSSDLRRRVTRRRKPRQWEAAGRSWRQRLGVFE
jgi:hypothetical protein